MTEELNNDQEQSDQPMANIYEKVIIAAKHARRINNKRLAEKEQLSLEEIAELDQRKVTSIALEDFDAKEIKFERKKSDSEEETYDLT
jgi:DNA-directed RNA polymerase subunit K/omega